MGNVESALDETIADARRQLDEAVGTFNGTKASREKGWKATGIVALRDGNLKELPTTALDLGPSVKTLDATNNRLAEVPAQLCKLTGLQRLVLCQNKLTLLHPAICQLSSLKILLLDSNLLTELPADIGTLTLLEKLSVSSNALTALPDSMRMLKKLKSLNVSSNRLAELPAALGDCTELEELDARSNAISELRPELGQLVRLRMAQMDSNAVARVAPEVLRGCAMLQTLSLHGNPITPDTLQETPGWAEFEARLKDKHGKRIAGGVMLGKAGLDDGLDHNTTRIVVPHR